MFKRILLAFFILVAIFVCWEWGASHFETNRFLFPSPSAIWSRLAERPDRFFLHTMVTVKEMLGGMALAFLAAFPLSWTMLRWSSVGAMLQPFFVFVQCIPMFVLAPLMVFWFGWSFTAIVIPTALMVFFPLTITLYKGFRSTPAHFLDFFRHHQATSWQLFSKLQLPWSMPYLFAGLRISASIAGIGAIAAEWAGAQEGLGILMLESRRASDLPTLFAALFSLAAVTMSFYAFILAIEKKWVVRFAQHAAFLLVFLGILASGCSKKADSTSTRLLLDWLPNPNHVPLFAGIEKGIFKAHGIEMRILKIHDPADGIPFLTSGQADISVFYTTETIRANRRGAQLRPIGVLIDRPLNSLIFRKGLGIHEPKDLEGKVIGYSSDGSSHRVFQRLLQLNGIQPKKMLNVAFDLVGTLGLERADAIFGGFWNIEGEHLRSLGVETGYFDVAQLGYPSYPELIFIANEGSQQTAPDFLKAFQESVQESIRYSAEHPIEAFKAYAKANPDKSYQTLEWEKKAWEKTAPLLARSQHIDEAEWAFLAHWLQTQGYFE